jgi:cysteinyl-tRNA synthetase, unknown class
MKTFGPSLAAALWMTLVIGLQADEQAQNKAEKLRSTSLAAVRRFGYQLQKLNVPAASASPTDLLVIEPHGDGGPRTAAEVARLRKQPNGGRRILLAYLSIGEAEDYRPYWKKEWKTRPPAWLGAENPQWKGNFEVKYWDPQWQALILGNQTAPLDQIVATGFDGAYLDIVDGYEYWERKGVKDARQSMIAWVKRIADYARKTRPEFLIVPQNGAALAKDKKYLDVVDALGREDLFFNGDKRQSAKESAEGIAEIKRFLDANKPVLLVEYCQKQANTAEVLRKAKENKYIPLVTVRPLDQLRMTPELK